MGAASYLLSPVRHDGDEDPGQHRPPAVWSPQLCLGHALPGLQDRYAGETQSHQEPVRRCLEVSDLPQHAPSVHLLHDCSPLQHCETTQTCPRPHLCLSRLPHWNVCRDHILEYLGCGHRTYISQDSGRLLPGHSEPLYAHNSDSTSAGTTLSREAQLPLKI